MRRPPTTRDLKVREGPTVQLETEIVIAKSRWGRFPRGDMNDPWPRYTWVPEYLRLIPLSRDEAILRAWADAEADEEADKKKREKREKATVQAATPQGVKAGDAQNEEEEQPVEDKGDVDSVANGVTR
jgi:hypothetical protein